MFSSSNYELLDFGDGRRLERFGSFCVDRPCPTAESQSRTAPQPWQPADAHFTRTGPATGRWQSTRDFSPEWTISHGTVVLELKLVDSGQVGVFPEQAANWDWIAAQQAAATHPLRILNLFAYTGGSTLAAAAAGATVVHVDAARTAVAWARRNAERSDLAGAPIRWIVDDALKFARRECKRGSEYDAVILDPPSYGHGAGGEAWRLDQHLPELLELCGHLTARRRRFLLLTCHTPEYPAKRLQSLCADAFGTAAGRLTAGPMVLTTAGGQQLPSGVAVRWEAIPRG